MNDSINRLRAVVQRTGRCKTSIYAGVKDGTFPPPVRIGARSVGWKASDIDVWIASRESTRRAA